MEELVTSDPVCGYREDNTHHLPQRKTINMRVKTVFRISVLIAFLGAFGLTTLQAQTKPPKTTLKGAELYSDPDIKNTPYCDQIMPRITKDLQAKANSTCETQETCILCLERETRHPLYATVFLQPDPAVCSSAGVQTEAVVDSERRALQNTDRPNPPFQAEILQSTCVNGGNTLDVYILGNGINREYHKDAFTYLWTVDGNKAGHAGRIDCACGNVAEVRITKAATGESITKRAKLRPCKTNE